MKISEEYIDNLFEGLPKKLVTMHKYPPNGLSLSNPIQREEILLYLTAIKETALSYKPD